MHDLIVLLGLSLTACGPQGGDDPDHGGDPHEGDALELTLDACRPFGQAMEACNEERPEYGYVWTVGYCVAQVGYAEQLPACGAAYRDYFACLTELDCEDLTWDDDVGEEGGEDEVAPCDAEDRAVAEACDSLFGD